MKPVVMETEQIIKEKKLDVKFIFVDAEEAKLFRDPSAEFDVLKVPSFYVVKNGVAKHLGYKYIPSEILVKAIEE